MSPPGSRLERAPPLPLPAPSRLSRRFPSGLPQDSEAVTIGTLITRGERPDMEAVPPDCPEKLRDLMVQCWVPRASHALRPAPCALRPAPCALRPAPMALRPWHQSPPPLLFRSQAALQTPIFAAPCGGVRFTSLIRLQ